MSDAILENCACKSTTYFTMCLRLLNCKICGSQSGAAEDWSRLYVKQHRLVNNYWHTETLWCFLTYRNSIPSGLIHGDFNDQNVLVTPGPSDESWEIAAVLDFGHAHHSCYLFELAICLCYVMLLAADTDPLDAGGHVIAGYSTVRRLSDVELSLLKASHNSLVQLTCRHLKW